MFKTALITMAMLFGPVIANAESGSYDVLNDSVTINIVSISSSVVGGQKQLMLGTLSGTTTGFQLLMENRKYLEIQNISATAGVFCVVDVSSTSASGDYGELTTPSTLSTTQGRYIAPYGSWTIALTARNSDGRVFLPFCVNNSGSATSKVALVQARSK